MTFSDLAIYLWPRSAIPGIGPERGPSRPPRSGIARYVSDHGSVRYVSYQDQKPVAALQVVTRNGRHAVIANVYTAPNERRRGLARKLLERARHDFETVEHSEHLSDDARLWRTAVRDRRQR